MATGNDFPLSLTIKAIDKATGPLRAITAKLNEVSAPSRQLGKDFEKFSKAANLDGIGKGFAGVGGAVKNVAGEAFALGEKLLTMGAVAGFAFFEITKSATEAGAELAKMSERTGLAVDAYASLGYAAGQADISQEEFNGGMDKFSKALGMAKANGGPLLEFLNKVAPALGEQFKHAKNTEQGLSLITDAMVKLDDPAKRAALAAAAFGKSGLQFATFLHKGSPEIQKAQLEYLRLAGSQEEFAEGGHELDIAMKGTEAAFGGLRSAAFGALFPVFTQLTKAVTEFIVANRGGIKKWAEETAAAIKKWIDGGGIARLVDSIKGIVKTVGDTVDMLGGFKVVAAGAAAIMAGPLIASILGLVGAVGSLLYALAPLAIAFAPLLVAAAPFIAVGAAIALTGAQIYLAWEPIKDLFAALRKTMGGLGEIFVGIATLDFSKVIDGWTQAIDGFRATLAPVIALMSLIPGGTLALNAIAKTGAFGDVAAPNQSFDIQSIEAARPGAVTTSQSQAKVSVDFSNLPRGARVSVDSSSSQPVDLSTGYSMVSQ